MKRLILAAVLPLLASSAFAQGRGNLFSTKAQAEFQNAITSDTRFGVPGYATASLPTCGTTNKRAVAYDTTLNQMVLCNGTSWGFYIGTITSATVQSPSSPYAIKIQEPAPGAATTALAGAGAGNVDNGAHLVRVTCYSSAGETSGGTVSNSTTVADKTVNGRIALTSIPLCSSTVTGRKVYMSTVAGSYFLLSNGTLADNTTTTLTANDSDATLAASTALPTANTEWDTRFSCAATAGTPNTTGCLIPDGTQVAPGIAFASNSNTGIYRVGANQIGFSANGVLRALISDTKMYVSGIPISFGDANFLTGGTTATLQLGAANAASPVAQTLQAQGTTSNDVAGANLTIQPGQGKGNATSSQLIFKAGTPQASGSTAQTMNTVLTLTDSGSAGTSKPQALAPAGVAGNPSYSFSSDATTGVFSEGVGTLSFSAGGGRYAYLSSTGLTVINVVPLSNQSYNLGNTTNYWNNNYLSVSTQGSRGTTVTDASPTTFLKVAVASGSAWSGDILYVVEGKDGTDWTRSSGRVNVTAINKAGTITCNVGTVADTSALTSGGKTQTLTGFTCADATSNVLNILVNYTDNLVDSANWPKIFYRVDSVDTAAITPQ